MQAYKFTPQVVAGRLQRYFPNLRGTLTVLKEAQLPLVEEVLATLSLGSRYVLVSFGVIAHVRNHQSGPVEVTLTKFGQEVIEACSALGLPPNADQKTAELQQALRERRLAAKREAGYGRSFP